MPTPYEENLIFSIKFVKTIEKYPFIWNFNLPEHNRRDIVSSCWKAVSEEVSQPVSVCRERWNNTRKSLKYALTYEGKPKKKYYLSDHLDFVIPFMKLQPSLYAKDQINLNQNISNVKNVVNNQQNITASRTDEDETVEISNEESLKSNKSSSKHTTTPVRVQLLNGKQNVPANNDDSGIYVQCRVRKKKAKTAEVNGKQSFLSSLLPYLREMTGKQNRRFRQKAVALIDEILDDADIPQMILPSISTRDSPVSSHLPGISYERHFRSVNERTVADLGQLN